MSTQAQIATIPRQVQVQYSVEDQLCVLAQAAVKIGLEQRSSKVTHAFRQLRPEDQAIVDAIPQQLYVEVPRLKKTLLLEALANQLGLYDAADNMRRHRERRNG